MKKPFVNRVKIVILGIAMLSKVFGNELAEKLEVIQLNCQNEAVLKDLLPIVHCSFIPSKYEQVLMTQLRSCHSSTSEFRNASEKIAELLMNKVVECLPSKTVEIQTPVANCQGVRLADRIELVSIMRSGDAILDTFMEHFPDSNVSKLLIQRDELTAEARFKYMKISPELSSGNPVVITEPMIATGGSLEMAISILKEKGVREENIIVASICTAPEGLIYLSERFPKIKVVMTVLDVRLNEHKFIVPGIGDFGDRFFGTL